MLAVRDIIIKHLCYTDLVYGRINKKLKSNDSNEQIEAMILRLIRETPEEAFIKRGKNYYVHHATSKVIVTINSNTYRVITAETIDDTKRRVQ